VLQSSRLRWPVFSERPRSDGATGGSRTVSREKASLPVTPIPTDILHSLARKTPSKILLVVCDGLGGLPHPETGLTEMETAATPHLDALARRSMQGYAELVGPGITPGSGPGHLSIFGYDPYRNLVGRGVLSALGVGFELEPQDVAARINFCSLDSDGRIVDRRAGRIATDLSRPLVERLRAIQLPSAQVFVEPEMDYRAVLVIRGDGLSDLISDTDPQVVGVPPLEPRPLQTTAQRTAELAAEFVRQARSILQDQHAANGVLLRGFSKQPELPLVGALYQLEAAAIATYPMYRGLARLVGMKILQTGTSMRDEIATAREHWDTFDFFFIHFKYTDSAGEDGNFKRKVQVIEEIDDLIPELLALEPDVFAVTGDHSTPAIMAGHSWHPSPFLLHSPWVLPDGLDRFTERTARRGNLGHFHMSQAMALLLAHAGKLLKYGA
jgi:2,3-bisphosphoglycerate-independent phosphoglycerate mutase